MIVAHSALAKLLHNLGHLSRVHATRKLRQSELPRNRRLRTLGILSNGIVGQQSSIDAAAAATAGVPRRGQYCHGPIRLLKFKLMHKNSPSPVLSWSVALPRLSGRLHLRLPLLSPLFSD